jgi:hypothetical protein
MQSLPTGISKSRHLGDICGRDSLDALSVTFIDLMSAVPSSPARVLLSARQSRFERDRPPLGPSATSRVRDRDRQ